MNKIAEKILNNKSDYKRNLDYLDLKYNGIFSKKLMKEKKFKPNWNWKTGINMGVTWNVLLWSYRSS